MEFPHLGQHCSEKSCKQLDFLPVKCDACSLTFCREHYHYGNHSCTNQYRKDKQVPVCPLCNRPIPLLPGELADAKVGAHIDTDCQSDPAKERRGKVYTHKCTFNGCKKKEVVSLQCNGCRQNYCLRHRHEKDHSCSGFDGSSRATSNAGAAAIARGGNKSTVVSSNPQSSSKPKAPDQRLPPTMAAVGRELDVERQRRLARAAAPSVPVGSFQGGMTEEEALNAALAASMQDTSGGSAVGSRTLTEQEQNDLALARALAASEDEARRQRQQQAQPEQSKCYLS